MQIDHQNSRGRLLSTSVVARLSGVPARTLRWYAQTKQIPAFRVGPKLWMFDRADVQAFISERRVSAEQAAW